MTTMLFAPAAYARYQTSGASYTADAKGVIAAAAAVDVIDLIRSGCTMLPAYDNLSATTDPSGSDDHTQDYSAARAGSTAPPDAPGPAFRQRPVPRSGYSTASFLGSVSCPLTC
jgi:hypothetical protein